MTVTLSLLPSGDLVCRRGSPCDENRDDSGVEERVQQAFDLSTGAGLLHLGAVECETHLPPVLAYWRDFSRRMCLGITQNPELESLRGKATAELSETEAAALVDSAPPLQGGEYLNGEMLLALWRQIHEAFSAEILHHSGTVAQWFQAKNPLWNAVGKVCFHLAENKGSVERPFAFLATYATRISEKGRVQHRPLGAAVEEGLARNERDFLLRLLEPVQRAAKNGKFLSEIVTRNAIFKPQMWTPSEAHSFLKEVPLYEEAGILVRVPPWWRPTPRRARVQAKIGDKSKGQLGMASLLSFSVGVSLEGEALTPAEIEAILNSVDGLVLIRGKWVDISAEEIKKAFEKWKSYERLAAAEGISFLQAMRLLSGANPAAGGDALEALEGEANRWSEIVAGGALVGILEKLRAPQGLLLDSQPKGLKAVLRPYQEKGVAWLHFVTRLGLGACLADDMGLGKTIQVIGYFLRLKSEGVKLPHLVVAPASLLGNWKGELNRFAPGLMVRVLHGSGENLGSEISEGVDVAVTTYGWVLRNSWIRTRQWATVVVDEAQTLKNPDAQQTRAVKELQATARVALTGTPVENRLGDLWSIFDFLNPGLLGTRKKFDAFSKRLQSTSPDDFSLLRHLTHPYILRRMKTDRSIITDLPDKTEVRVECGMSRKQIAIYGSVVEDLKHKLEEAEGIARQGLVLAALVRLKQICNHPSQWLGDGAWNPEESGKFARLTQICEEIASRGEKVLVFTQFKEIVDVLAFHLKGVFGGEGLQLHGGTPVKERQRLVQEFQDSRRHPFFVLSLKAGGTGLNLTAANHVIHFDRWWNPAVENQATDRAFRIGQHKNVMVHKFVTLGTLEEKIDALIGAKKALAHEVLGVKGDEVVLTDLDNEALLRMVSLDLESLMGEEE